MLEIPADLVDALKKAPRVAALTGAGISAESGIPTFRDAQTGLWSRYRPEELATPAAFARDPELVWQWYGWRRELVQKAHPNPGHRALARLETLVPEFTLITQNVDGLHQAAGSRAILELHGNLQRARCTAEGRTVEPWEMPSAGLPSCSNCGALLRPDVVWFGESLDPAVLARAQQAARRAEVFLSIGTSAVVEPAASLPRLARSRGALVVEINPQATPLTKRADFVLPYPAGEALPELLERFGDGP